MANYASPADEELDFSYPGYVYGSAAPAYQPVPAIPEVRPEQPKAPEQPKPQEPASQPKHGLRKVTSFLFLAVLLGTLLAPVIMYAKSFAEQREIAALKSELAAAVQYTVIAGTGSEERAGLADLRGYALDVLKMRNPKADEVLTLSVDAASYTVDYTVEEPETRTLGFHWFGNH